MATSLKQSRTLVIDDFQSMRAMVMTFLKTMGVTRIDNAGTAQEALAFLSKNKYDIVICDYNLGRGKNGQQILEEAKYKNYIGYSTIWMMVTAEKTMDMFMGAAETKPDDYLLKPITESLLETRLNKLIEKKLSLEPIEKAAKSRNYVHAISLCEEQLKQPSTNTQELQRIKTDLLMTMGDFAGAKSFFESILAVRSMPWAKTGLGKVHYLLKDFDRAGAIFQEVLNENKMYLEAADWLAKTLDAQGSLDKAQEVLAKAMLLSPNAAARQKNLADAAYKNGDLDLAQDSYEKAIKLSEHSVHKNASTYAGLANVLTEKDDPDAAIKVLDRSKVEFKDDPAAILQTAVVESIAYQKMGQPHKAAAALAQAEGLMDSQSNSINVSVSLDMAKALFKSGQTEKAFKLLESVIKNNHDNAGIIKMVEAVFDDAGQLTEGKALIQKASQAVIEINNQGVLLAHDGKFEDGIKLIQRALETLPNNDLMIMNLCGMLIGLMSKNGATNILIGEARELLERVQKINPSNKKYNTYMTMVNNLAAQLAM
jgi:tetratricopeptide (TPR) repeat protein